MSSSALRAAFAAFTFGLAAVATIAATPTLSIDVGQPAGPVSPRLYGLMTEEINHSYDGGLLAELIHNRALMDDAKEPKFWSAVGGDGVAKISLDPSQPFRENIPTSLKVDVSKASADALAGTANEGFWGFPVTPNTTYKASFFAKAAAGLDGPVTLALQSPDGTTTFAKTTVTGLTGDWKKYDATLQTPADVKPTTKARFALLLDRPGTVWLSQVSLQPPTWNDQPNGFRKDLMQMLIDLNPKFLRFPGGNFLEGNTVENRWEWKKTIGPIEHRAGHMGTWGYRASDGMGLLEFLQWCEAMKAEPVLGLFAGYTLNKDYIEAGPKLEPYVQDALEEIEYVVGDAKTTKWGARRAADGHPEPFKLNYVEVGNEDWFDKSNSYQGRYAQFHDAIRAKYPQLKIISSVGNEQPKELQVTSRVPDVVDEHYYRSADEFIKDAPTFYEQYSRQKRPEIFVGEWAAHEDAKVRPWSKEAKSQPSTPNMKVALGDAAFMASMERNADLITMHCYAPLLVNVNPGAWQWRPNLIGYDALTSFGSPSYHAIKMFSTNLGDQYLKLTATDTAIQASATRESKTGDVHIKLVNPTAAAVNLRIDLKGAPRVGESASVQTMAADENATNSIDQPTNVVPKTSTFPVPSPAFDFPVPASSIVVLTVKTK